MSHPEIPVGHERFKFYAPTVSHDRKEEWCYVTSRRYGSEFHSIEDLGQDDDESEELRQDCAAHAAAWWFEEYERRSDDFFVKDDKPHWELMNQAWENIKAWLAWGADK